MKGFGSVLLLGPASWVVARLVADQGEGDPVGAVCHRTGDDHALLASVAQLGAVDLGGRIAQPQSDTQIDQGAARSSTLPSRLITLSRRLPADSYWIGLSPAVR